MADKFSKYKGVSWSKSGEKWRSTFHINGKNIHLGMFETEEEAYEAYKNKAIECGEERRLNNLTDKEYKRKWYADNREKMRKYHQDYRKNMTDEQKEKKRLTNQSSLRRLTQRVIQEYGGVCICCGETRWEFLTIDHINNDGYIHRKEIGCGQIYKWLRKNGFPKDNYRLLCYNCNCSRGRCGYCPHELEKSNEKETDSTRD